LAGNGPRSRERRRFLAAKEPGAEGDVQLVDQIRLEQSAENLRAAFADEPSHACIPTQGHHHRGEIHLL
jgi:hypothetical protein